MSISRSAKSAALFGLALTAGILATSTAAFAGGRGGYRQCWYDYYGHYHCSGGYGHGHDHGHGHY